MPAVRAFLSSGVFFPVVSVKSLWMFQAHIPTAVSANRIEWHEILFRLGSDLKLVDAEGEACPRVEFSSL